MTRRAIRPLTLALSEYRLPSKNAVLIRPTVRRQLYVLSTVLIFAAKSH